MTSTAHRYLFRVTWRYDDWHPNYKRRRYVGANQASLLARRLKQTGADFIVERTTVPTEAIGWRTHKTGGKW